MSPVLLAIVIWHKHRLQVPTVQPKPLNNPGWTRIAVGVLAVVVLAAPWVAAVAVAVAAVAAVVVPGGAILGVEAIL